MGSRNFTNEKGIVTGAVHEYGNLIQYNDLKHGLVGQYDKNIKKYHRLKTYNGNTSSPMDNRDYGEVDLLYWGAKR